MRRPCALLERQHLAAGASGGSAGMLVPIGHAGIGPPQFVDLRVAQSLVRASASAARSPTYAPA